MNFSSNFRRTRWSAFLGIVISSVFPLCGNCVAQVIPDGTLPNNSIINPVGNTINITGGTQAGGNLFHSFQEFSVRTGSEAVFDNAVDIENIISRVTGGSISNIDGFIRAKGRSNLFLINPSGIIFGPNARLDIGGSFIGSTASNVNFADGTQFRATPSPNQPLLTVTAPIGLGMGSNPGEIKVTGSGHGLVLKNIRDNPQLPVETNSTGLQLREGKTLALVGSKVSLEGGVLKSPGGRIEIGSVGSNGVVSLGVLPEGWKLGYEGTSSFGDIQFSKKSFLSTTGVGGGAIAIAGQNINFTEESIIVASNIGTEGTSAINAGKISILATFFDSENSVLRTSTVENGIGNAGNININVVGHLSLGNSGLDTNTYGNGNAGEITIVADSFKLEKDAVLSNNTQSKGDAGKINITANSFELEGGAVVSLANENSTGNAGDININVSGSVRIKSAAVRTTTSGRGNAGKINLSANSFNLLERGVVESLAKENSTGNAGNINMTANSFELHGGGIKSDAAKDSTGNAGNINITAGSFNLGNDAAISTNTQSKGDAGKINITANSFQLEGGAVESNATENSTGNAGDININVSGSVAIAEAGVKTTSSGTGNAGKINMTAKSFEIENTGVESNTKNTGNAGNININVAGPISLRKSNLHTNTYGKGDAGNISMTANSLIMEGAAIGGQTERDSIGKAGNININVAGSMEINEASITADAFGSESNGGKINITANSLRIEKSRVLSRAENTAKAGEVTIVADSFLMVNSSSIKTNINGEGNAGNINITVNSFQIDNKAGILSGTEGKDSTGNAGEITIVADSFKLLNNAAISTNTQSKGDAGKINITAKSFELQGGEIKSDAAKDSTGNAGDININVTDSVRINSAGVKTTSLGTGNAGKINISANSFELENSGVFSPTDNIVNAGEININVTGPMVIKNGSIKTDTSSGGNAGRITVTAESLKISNGDGVNDIGIFATTSSSGNAGKLTVKVKNLVIDNQGALKVESTGDGNAGTLMIVADTIQLDNHSQINATSASGKGGDIQLQIKNLLSLRRGSSISTSAGTDNKGGDGGNITINAPNGFILTVANENSDITANTYSGLGGKIRIRSTAIFGMSVLSRQERKRLGSDFDPRKLQTNDITANSQTDPNLSGTIELYIPELDINNSLVNLPSVPVETEFATGCSPRNYAQNSFVVTGRGGLPLDPKDFLSADAVLVDWVSLTSDRENRKSRSHTTKPTTTTTPETIVEATGWVLNQKGEVVLTANPSTIIPVEHKPGFLKKPGFFECAYPK